MKDVINGSLYVNKEVNQVERVRSKANTQSVFTTVHGKNLKLVDVKSLVLASNSQVDGYVNESEKDKGAAVNIRSLPPLPRVSV